MKKNVKLALVAAFVFSPVTALHADALRARVVGPVSDIDLASRTFNVGITRVYLGSAAELPLIGSQVRAVGLVSPNGTVIVDQLITIDGSKLVVEVSCVGVFFFQFDGQQPRT